MCGGPLRINGFPTPIANPMSGYPMYAGTRKTWGINALGTLVVEVCVCMFVCMYVYMYVFACMYVRVRLRDMFYRNI